MKFLSAAALGLVVFASATLGAGQTKTAAPAPVVRPVRSSAAPAPDAGFLSKYCITCHNPRAKTGGLALETEGLAHVARHHAVGQLTAPVSRRWVELTGQPGGAAPGWIVIGELGMIARVRPQPVLDTLEP